MKDIPNNEIDTIISSGSERLGNLIVDKIFDFLNSIDLFQFYGVQDRYTKKIHSEIVLKALSRLPELIEKKLNKK